MLRRPTSTAFVMWLGYALLGAVVVALLVLDAGDLLAFADGDGGLLERRGSVLSVLGGGLLLAGAFALATKLRVLGGLALPPGIACAAVGWERLRWRR